MFFKMARWAADKGWPASLQAVAQMRAAGYDVGLVARGSGDPTAGAEVVEMAQGLGLKVAETSAADDSFVAKTAALEAARQADVVFMRSFVDEQLGRALYAAADGVLANSTFEPFGLVGLEAMAAGGVAYTGGTGEDYALPGYNAVVLESDDPREIVEYAERLQSAPSRERALRRAGQRTAAAFTWDTAAERLVRSVRFGTGRGLSPAAGRPTAPGPGPAVAPGDRTSPP
jgi:glycosyltransferase involved in cell wall biosynthesis